MKVYYIYSAACMNCHYVSLLLKLHNIDDKIEQIEIESSKGEEFKRKYSINRVPIILVYNNDKLVIRIDNIEKRDIQQLAYSLS